MRGVNKVIIIGNLGADPESRQFNNGGSVTTISVATSEQWTDKQSGEKKKRLNGTVSHFSIVCGNCRSVLT